MLSARATAILAVPVLTILMAVLTRPARAGDEYETRTCDSLWIERNAMFKGAGYCFQSPRAIKTFGNENCQYDSESDVPLSDNQRDRLRDVRTAERAKGC
ncbi:MAG: YARHG domain-containing protein [Hyphomicrobium sp.]